MFETPGEIDSYALIFQRTEILLGFDFMLKLSPIRQNPHK